MCGEIDLTLFAGGCFLAGACFVAAVAWLYKRIGDNA